jgi:HK97 family phage major capsid protein
MDRTLALQAWFRGNMGLLPSAHQQEAADRIRLNWRSPRLDLLTAGNDWHRRARDIYRSNHHSNARHLLQQEFKASLSTVSGPGGAYLVPPETLTRELEINLLYYGGIRQVAETMETTSGERMSWPTVDDTTNKGRRLGASAAIGTGGNPATTGANDPTFGKVYWDAYKYTSDAILVPFELLEDSAFQLPQVLGELLGIRLGRITNTEYTTGTGNSQPKGIVAAATAFSASSSTALLADDILGLYHSVDPAYRQQPGTGIMMNDQIILAARKLKDGIGQYLWQAGLQLNRPDMLIGEPVTINQDMDSTIASGKKTILYGKLDNYKIRRVKGLRLYRLEERYRDNDQDAFLAFIREDGNLLTAGTAPVKYLSH